MITFTCPGCQATFVHRKRGRCRECGARIVIAGTSRYRVFDRSETVYVLNKRRQLVQVLEPNVR